jgi:nucleotide-binding universal stress UspA family protein
MTVTTTQRRIAIPIDGSAHSKATVEYYLNHIVKPHDLVSLLHVQYATEPLIDLPKPMESDVRDVDFSASIAQLEDGIQRESQDLFVTHVAMLKGKAETETVLLRGDARHEIASYVETTKPDLCIMGRRGLGLLSRALLGSVSSHVMTHTKVPVLIVSE